MRATRAYEGMPAYDAGYNDCKEDILQRLCKLREMREEQIAEQREMLPDGVINNYTIQLQHCWEEVNYIIKIINTEIGDIKPSNLERL